jgi:hypothetical protein
MINILRRLHLDVSLTSVIARRLTLVAISCCLAVVRGRRLILLLIVVARVVLSWRMANRYSSCPASSIERCSTGTTSATSANTTDHELFEFEGAWVTFLPAQEEKNEECD